MIVRAAMTETCNAFADMPARVEELPRLADRMEEVRAANVEHNLQLVGEARRRGATIIGLGELFPAPYFALSEQPFWRDMAEDPVDGLTITAMRLAAAQHQMVIVAPIYELCGQERFNTAVVVDADGTIAGRYRKLHIPCGENEQATFHETFYYSPSVGDPNEGGARVGGINARLPVFQTVVAQVGVAICYDRHFEGVMSGLARGGAQIVFSPAVAFGDKSERLWRLEFDVDATRHNIFIGGSNRRGSEPPWNQSFYGRSRFVGPNGRAENLSDHPNLIISDLDLSELEKPDPSGWKLQRDSRDDLG